MSYRFRPTAARDRDAVFAFCAQTYPNGDYLPLVWDDWLADTEGAFIAGVDEADQPIAVVKLVVAAPGEAGWRGCGWRPSAASAGWGARC